MLAHFRDLVGSGVISIGEGRGALWFWAWMFINSGSVKTVTLR